MSKIIKKDVKVIFTTAYPQFALESYDLDAVDYLLKPFEFERFYQVVLKVKAFENKYVEKSKIDEYIFLKDDFIKTHKSFIVAIQHIDTTTTESVFICQKEIPIGDTYKKAFFELINSKKL